MFWIIGNGESKWKSFSAKIIFVQAFHWWRKPKSTEFRYGKITKRVVIYRGENTTLENGIEYGNAEEYLKSLVWSEIEHFGNEGQKTKKQKIKNLKSQINTAIWDNADIFVVLYQKQIFMLQNLKQLINGWLNLFNRKTNHT